MKKLILLSMAIISLNIQAASNSNYKEKIYKDFIIEPLSFINSKFYKTTNKSSNYGKFFNTFVLEKSLKKELIEKNSFSDLLNICYHMYLDRDDSRFLKNKNEGKFCLYTYAIAGSKDAYSYISTYHFDKYKEIIVSKNEVDINNLIKMSVYAGLSESSHIEGGVDGLLESEILTFDKIISEPVVKIKNKNTLLNYKSQGVLSSLDIPVNTSLYQNFNTNHYMELTEEYDIRISETIEEKNKKIHKDIKRNNFKSLYTLLLGNNKEEEEKIEKIKKINQKEYIEFRNICKDTLYGENNYNLENIVAEYCLTQISLNNLDIKSSYDLGLYFYVLGNNAKEDKELEKFYFDKSIVWLALSYELGELNSTKVFKRILITQKSDKVKFNNLIQKFNFERKISKMLIENKIKNQ